MARKTKRQEVVKPDSSEDASAESEGESIPTPAPPVLKGECCSSWYRRAYPCLHHLCSRVSVAAADAGEHPHACTTCTQGWVLLAAGAGEYPHACTTCTQGWLLQQLVQESIPTPAPPVFKGELLQLVQESIPTPAPPVLKGESCSWCRRVSPHLHHLYSRVSVETAGAGEHLHSHTTCAQGWVLLQLVQESIPTLALPVQECCHSWWRRMF